MAHVTGRSGKFATSSDGVSYTDVGGVRDVSTTPSGDTIETTDFDDSGNKTFLAGNTTTTISVSGYYDGTDAGQDLLWTCYAAKGTYYFRYRPEGDTSTKEQWSGQGIITGLSYTQAQDGAVEFSLDVQVTGAWTKSAIP